MSQTIFSLGHFYFVMLENLATFANTFQFKLKDYAK